MSFLNDHAENFLQALKQVDRALEESSPVDKKTDELAFNGGMKKKHEDYFEALFDVMEWAKKKAVEEKE